MTNPNWDLDYSNGVEGEQLVNDLLAGGKTVEVKRDRRWAQTGNIYIELSCFYQSSKKWEPSGLLVSKADYWAFVLNTMVLLIPGEKLIKACRDYGRPAECNIEPNPSKGCLITVADLIAVSK